MNARTFDAVWDEAMERFREGEYTSVHTVLADQEEHFPDSLPLILYLRACASARQDDSEQAIDFLERARDADHWYSEFVMRNSPSFQSLQGLPEFEALVPVFNARYDAAYVGPKLLVSEPEQGCAPDVLCPLLLALHGNGENGEHAQRGWQLAVERGWLLAAAQSSQVTYNNSFNWDDRSIALPEVQAHFEALQARYALDPEWILLGGFSMGGETAIWATLSQTIPARGFIVLGPGGPTMDDAELWRPVIAEAQGLRLRGYILMGDADPTIPHVEIRKLVEMLNEGGISCGLETIPNLVHRFPDDFDAYLDRALAFVLDTGS